MLRMLRSASVLALACWCMVAAGCAGRTSAVEQRQAVESAMSQVKPALVRIAIVEPSHYDGRESKFVASGSGVIVSPDGHVVTNHHVAGKAVRIVCTLPNREEVPAELVGTDAATDIAVVRLLPETPTTFPYARFGDSDAIRVGDTVLALGSPLGLSQSVTMGIVSNTEMVIPSIYRTEFRLDGENIGELVRWIGHDAEIHGGNSGGPLINLAGEIVGINEISFGLAGAIPGNLARAVADQIIANGSVRRAYAGFSMQPLPKSLDTQEGVLIATVFEGSPAAKANVQTGDIVTAIAGQPVRVQFFEDLPPVNNLIANLPIGEPVPLAIRRGSSDIVLTLVPEVRLPARPRDFEVREWGITARDLSVFSQLEMARETSNGVLVSSTRPGGPAAKAKPDIRRGDVIVRVDDEPVPTFEAFQNMTRRVVADSDRPVEVLVEYERDRETLLTVVSVGIEELNDPGRDVRRAWLPMESQVLTPDLATRLGLSGTRGVRVTRLYDDRPEDFPFQVGDIITHIDDEEIEASQPHDIEVFRTMVRQYSITAMPEFRVIRGGEPITLTSALVLSPLKSREMVRHRDLDFEFIVREATYHERQDPKLRGVTVEVVVESVTEGGWASLGDLRVGDIVVALAGSPIASLADARAALAKVHEQRPRRVPVRVRRGIQDLYLELEPFWDDRPTGKEVAP
ncbi:MAG: PDZ domain-containing protein [Candidatus Sumerlaeia bacterium]|nr:PDZ domain-containing protein [Candidatus Sumerlaeia bacterium]